MESINETFKNVPDWQFGIANLCLPSHHMMITRLFCGWFQEAVKQTVNVIFDDPGVQELLVKLYQKGESFFLLQIG